MKTLTKTKHSTGETVGPNVSGTPHPPPKSKEIVEPVIVPKRKRRLDGIDQIDLSLSARGLTTGEIAAHFEEGRGQGP